MHIPISASIVVPSRGGAQRLKVLLKALSVQSQSNFEVLIVVDGDIDGTENMVKEASATVPYTLESIVFPENRGRAAALNAGFAEARGEVLIRCDDDLEPGPDFVSGHIRRHQGTPNGIIGLTTNRFPNTVYARLYGNKVDLQHRRDAVNSPLASHWRHWAANVSVTRDLHKLVGGYDERYRAYGWEDVDYGYRLKKTGVPVLIAPELTAVHHAASTTTAIRASRALHSGAARDTFLSLNGRESLGGSPIRFGLWGTLIWAGSTVATEKTIAIWASGVDAVADWLPRPVSVKLIALTVESAGLAGIRYPKRARSRF